MMCLLTSSATAPPYPCATASVSVAPGDTSSLTPINVRSFHSLSSASSMAAGGRAIATSPASPVMASLSFLPFPLQKVLVSDCCSDLDLCWCCEPDALCRYVVCNLATHKWHVLPRSIRSIGQARLGFDPTSSHFHVIEFVEVEGAYVGVEIYSSKTATWIFK